MAYFNGRKEVFSVKTSRKFYSAGARTVDFNDYYFVRHSTDAKIWIDVDIEGMGLTRGVYDLCEVNGMQVMSGYDGNSYVLVLSEDDFETWSKYPVAYNVVQMEYDGLNGIVGFGTQTSSDKSILSIELNGVDNPPTLSVRLPDFRVWRSVTENRLFEIDGKFVYSDGIAVYSSNDGFEWQALMPLFNPSWFTKFKDKFYYRIRDANAFPSVYKTYRTSDFITIEEITGLPEDDDNLTMTTRGEVEQPELRLWHVPTLSFYVFNQDESLSVIETQGVLTNEYIGNYMHIPNSNIYRMFGYQKMYSSTDGISWSYTYFDFIKTSMVIGNQMLIITRTNGNDFGIKSSDDGVTWTINPTVNTVQGEFAGWSFHVLANGTRYLYRAGDDSMTGFWASQDGIIWDQVSPPWTNYNQQLFLGSIGNTLHAFLTQNNVTILRSRAASASVWQGMDPEIIDKPRMNYLGSDGFGTIYLTENNWIRPDTVLYLSTDRGRTLEPFSVPIERNTWDRDVITKIGIYTYITGSYYDQDTSNLYVGLFRTTNYTSWDRIDVQNSNLQNATLQWCALTYDGKKWALPVVMSQFYQGNLLLYTSTDQINWRSIVLNSTDESVNWVEDVGGKNYITLSAQYLAQNDSHYLSMNTLEGKTIVGGDLDGTSWTPWNTDNIDVNDTTPPIGSGHLFSMFYYGGGDGSRFLFSPDAVEWFDPVEPMFGGYRENGRNYFYTTETEIFEYNINDIDTGTSFEYQLVSNLRDYSGNIIDTHIIDTITDGGNQPIHPFYCGMFNGKHYVVVADYCYSSTDRITWTKSNSGEGIYFNDLDITNFYQAQNGTQMVFATNGGYVITSTDLVNWTKKPFTDIQFISFSSLSYSSIRNKFIVAYRYWDNDLMQSVYVIKESSDLENWTTIDTPYIPPNPDGNNGTTIRIGCNLTADIAFLETTGTNFRPIQTDLFKLEGSTWTQIIYGDSPNGLYVGGVLSNVPDFVNVLADINTNNTVLFCATATQET